MTAKQKLHQLKLQEWASRFSDQKASGLSVKEWCSLNSVSCYAYNYWKHQLREEACDQLLPDIVPLSFPASASNGSVPSIRANCANRSTPAIRITVSEVTIELDSAVPEAYLTSLIRAVRHA